MFPAAPRFLCLLLLILVCLMMMGCNDCTESVREQKRSPDGRFVAVYDYTDCGAGPSPISNIEIGEVSKSTRVVAVSAPVTPSHLEFQWVEDSILEVRCKRCERSEARLLQGSYNGVRIRLNVTE